MLVGLSSRILGRSFPKVLINLVKDINQIGPGRGCRAGRAEAITLTMNNFIEIMINFYVH